MEKENKLEKLKKLRALSEDKSTTDAERQLAYQKYTEFKEKYHLNDDEEEKKRFEIRVKNFYEWELFAYIAWSFGIEDTYKQKYCSKFKIIFYCTQNIFLALTDDFDFHKKNLHSILLGTAIKYMHVQVKKPKPATETEKNNSYDEILLKAYWGNTWLDNEDYNQKKKIENKQGREH